MRADRLWATRPAIALAALVMAAAPLAGAAGAPRSLVLGPTGTAFTLRAYALGFLPTDGAFSRFQGRIDYDATQPDRCSVELVAESASLAFAKQSVTDAVLSTTLLDAPGFPTLAYHGDCAGGSLQGQLAMHGQTHPLTLALDGDGTHLVATGTLDRTAWGVTGSGLTVGSSVRIQVSVLLPDAARGVLPGLLTTPAR